MLQDFSRNDKMVQKKETAKQLRMARFITATKELAKVQGIGTLSVRQIAEQAGYHNSTIYAYFKDEALLLSLACVPYFADYSRELACLSASNLSGYDSFFSIWEHFCTSAFQRPDAFWIFFSVSTATT